MLFKIGKFIFNTIMVIEDAVEQPKTHDYDLTQILQVRSTHLVVLLVGLQLTLAVHQ